MPSLVTAYILDEMHITKNIQLAFDSPCTYHQLPQPALGYLSCHFLSKKNHVTPHSTAYSE